MNNTELFDSIKSFCEQLQTTGYNVTGLVTLLIVTVFPLVWAYFRYQLNKKLEQSHQSLQGNDKGFSYEKFAEFLQKNNPKRREIHFDKDEKEHTTPEHSDGKASQFEKKDTRG